jgi:hypothetical protein
VAVVGALDKDQDNARWWMGTEAMPSVDRVDAGNAVAGESGWGEALSRGTSAAPGLSGLLLAAAHLLTRRGLHQRQGERLRSSLVSGLVGE